MRTKWASCSPSGIVTFSRDLLTESHTFGEAVIVHEMVHLIVRNHGKLFRSMVQSFMGLVEVAPEDRRFNVAERR